MNFYQFTNLKITLQERGSVLNVGIFSTKKKKNVIKCICTKNNFSVYHRCFNWCQQIQNRLHHEQFHPKSEITRKIKTILTHKKLFLKIQFVAFTKAYQKVFSIKGEFLNNFYSYKNQFKYTNYYRQIFYYTYNMPMQLVKLPL